MSRTQDHALRLPEICQAVFEHLDDASLAAAARVCRIWFSPAISVLWRAPREPPRRALAAVSGVRCLLYGPAIRQLSISEATPLDAWTFPAVRALRFRFRHSVTTRALHRVLDRCGDTLASVKFECADELRDSVPNRPRSTFLAAEDLLLLARRRGGLRHLHASYYLSRAAMQEAEADARVRFGQLRELALYLRGESVPAMLTLVDGGAHLAVLALRMMSVPPGHDWGVLAPLRALRELCIEHVSKHALTAAEFVSLGGLPAGLRMLRLLNNDPGSPEVGVEHWLAVASRLAHLTHLRADVRGQFDGAVLRILGEQCRWLEDLQLRMPCKPSELALSLEPMLLPCLRELQVDTFTGFERLNAKQARRRQLRLAGVLRRNFAPRLTVFCGIDVSEVKADDARPDEQADYEMAPDNDENNDDSFFEADDFDDDDEDDSDNEPNWSALDTSVPFDELFPAYDDASSEARSESDDDLREGAEEMWGERQKIRWFR